MLTKIFWTVLTLDVIAAFVLWKILDRGTHGFIILAFLVLIAIILIATAVFPFVRSDGWRAASFIVLLLPSAPLLYWSIAATVATIEQDRQFSGSAYFDGPALALAQAMVNQDPVSVKQLIPAAGDLNQPHGSGTTLWEFGVMQANGSPDSIEMLRALIAAGADPRRDTSSSTLEHATATGPELTKFLLEAGANPNLFDYEHRPMWWRTMGTAEDDEGTVLLRMLLDHGADLSLHRPDGRGPVAQAVADRYWYDACLFIERGADWKAEKVRGWPIPQLLEWEIIRRDEYPIQVPEKMRKALADMKGEPLVIPTPHSRAEGEISLPDLIRKTRFDNLDETRAALANLSQQPDWVRRVVAFFEEGDGTLHNEVALLLSLKPEALPEDVQERCWSVLHDQVAWYDRSAASDPGERKGWLLKDTGVIATGVASIAGPVRERHRLDFITLRDRIEELRKKNDPDVSKLPDLKQADWK